MAKLSLSPTGTLQCSNSGSDQIIVEGNIELIVRALSMQGLADPFYLPFLWPKLSFGSRAAIKDVSAGVRDLKMWWDIMASNWAVLNGYKSWPREALDIVWETTFCSEAIHEVMRVSTGKVFVATPPRVNRQNMVTHPSIIMSEKEFEAAQFCTLEAYLKGVPSARSSDIEIIVAAIRAPLEVREVQVVNAKGEVETLLLRGPQGESVHFWSSLPRGVTVLEETLIRTERGQDVVTQ